MKKIILSITLLCMSVIVYSQSNVTTTTPFGSIGYVPKFTSNVNIQNSMILDNGTNVGIGFPTAISPAPLTKIDVRGNGAFLTTETGALDFAAPSTYTHTFALHHRTNSGVAGNMILSRYWNADNNTRASVIYHYFDYASSTDCMAFNVTGGGGVYNNIWTFSASKMVINANGSVGIGLSTPASSSLLSLKGKGSSTSTYALNITNSTGGNSFVVRDDARIGIGTTAPTAKININSVDGIDYLSFSNYSGGHGSVNFRVDEIGLVRSNGFKGCIVQGTELRIGSYATGMDPIFEDYLDVINFKVESDGMIYARGITLEAGTFPDFVFEKDYDLMSLPELENYIQKNKHLPNVPSAAEVQDNGVNLGELNTTLLQKVEELTLYTISLQKQVDELKKQTGTK